MRRWCAALLFAAWPLTAAAETHPPIVDIAFEGNDTTQPKVMLRELVVRIGDPADPDALERSRQGLLDLGLFREVEVRTEAIDGGVRVVFRVDERYFLLPTPRFDAKSDGRYAYGAQLHWTNVAGRNHSLRVFAEQEDRRRQGIGRETNYAASYNAPFAFDSPYSLGVSIAYSSRPVETEAGEYEETFRGIGIGVSRSFSDGPASQGLSVGGGLGYQQQRTSGALAPPAYGAALSPSVFVSHRDFHNRIYSDIGRHWRLGARFADESLGSDYGYVDIDTAYVQQWPVGRTEHQTLHLRAYTGAYFSGPDEVKAYSLGGATFLRGYDSSFIEGNAYYYLTAEFARPVWQPWLRGVLIAELGNVFARPEDVEFGKTYGSLGVGLRVRFVRFVNFEVELGYAIPLDGGSGRIFASRV
ncbi:BamA/TamA family outer membrane protein [Sinimarinibacterium thermocellulolyticum]|uniref:BamA/TamA family outer membrane protein n=1 Tax=Sinimarinibacterium thermocellulolyticum TaxID=3170016 RepID=A0ABV2A6T6_9GAMM